MATAIGPTRRGNVSRSSAARSISIPRLTPFTNTLPIRRLKLRAAQAAEIVTVYILVPSLTLTTDPQRYTCIEPLKRYRYESIDSDFTRDIEVDRRGLVVVYPGLFSRLL